MNHPISPSPKWPPVIKRVLQTIDRYEMFVPDDKVLVGVSGGPDSTALLHILHSLAPVYGLKLSVAHLNHGLRPRDADKDEAFAKKMAEKLSLPYYRRQADIRTQNGSIEEQAREARYAFFYELMHRHGHTKIALGHHKNDNAEAVLMHLLRGSGTRGLAGIPPVRNNGVVRPLIQLDRSQIMAYLKDNGIPFVVDATNADPVFDRNRIRHHLIPIIEEQYNAGIVETLCRTADLLREEETWFNHYLKPLVDKAVARSEKDRLELHCRVLAREAPAVQRRLIRDALNRWYGHLRRMSAYHIDAVIGLLPGEAEGKRLSLPNGIQAMRRLSHLLFVKGDRSMPAATTVQHGFSYSVSGMDRLPLKIDIPESDCHLILKIEDLSQPYDFKFTDADRTWFDLQGLTFPLNIRNFRLGDRINPYGMQGSQKIKKLFIDRKIPIGQRHKIPLLVSHGTILWVIGLRRSNTAVVSDKTRRILSAQIVRAAEPKGAP